MRLTCPNCGAQYEVDERVIPRNGRDVQCSACGHTWYQYPMEVALQMRAAELEDDDEDDDAPAPASAAVEGAGRPTAPRIDKTVLDVLREEAERELNERKRRRETVETQGDLGLVRRPTRSKAAPSRIYGEDDPAPPPPPPDLPEDEPAEPIASAGKPRRRNLLPDIEELTSTLEPGDEPRKADHEAQNDLDGQRGFRRGLSVATMIVLALVALYLLAPLIASHVPAARGPLGAYVGAIDGLRATTATLMRGLFGG
ncbi:MAG: hypothetical protein Kow0013_08010 [Pararhodobacter sp.]